jgi:hypothetical protein
MMQRLHDSPAASVPVPPVPAVPEPVPETDIQVAEGLVSDLELALEDARASVASLNAQVENLDSATADVDAIREAVELKQRLKTEIALVDEIGARLAAARARYAELSKIPASFIAYGRTDMRDLNIPQPDGTTHRHGRPANSPVGQEPLVVDCPSCFSFLVERMGFSTSYATHPLTPDEVAAKEEHVDLMVQATEKVMSQMMEAATGVKLTSVGSFGRPKPRRS